MKKQILLLMMAVILMAISFSACADKQSENSLTIKETPSAKGEEESDLSSFIPSVSPKASTVPTPTVAPSKETKESGNESQTEETVLQITVGQQVFIADFADTEGAQALGDMLPMTLAMSDWEGVAKRFELPSILPETAEAFSSTQQGQLLLDGSSELCLFYQDSGQTGSYTLLATVREPEGLLQAMAGDTVEVAFELVTK